MKRVATAVVVIIILATLVGCQTISKPGVPPEQSSMAVSVESAVQASSKAQDKSLTHTPMKQ